MSTHCDCTAPGSLDTHLCYVGMAARARLAERGHNDPDAVVPVVMTVWI